jgi:hypothetical protein
MKLNPIQTCGGYNKDDSYSLTVAFNDNHAVTLDGLSHEDMLQLKSCIDCMIMEDEYGIGTTS